MTATLPTSLPLAPTDAPRGTAGIPPVAEIVRFRLVAPVTETEFLGATRAMQPLVARSRGYLSRRLSKNADGTWTDYVLWSDLDSALSAASEIFRDPATRRFAEAIDMASVDIRHESVVLDMG